MGPGTAALCFLCVWSCGALRAAPAKPQEPRRPSGNCSYKVFGSVPFLQGVQVLPTRTKHLPFKNFNHGSTQLEGLLVLPFHKLAMCIIEKNACTTWTNFFKRLLEPNPHTQQAWYGVVPAKWSEEGATRVFQDRESTRVVWVRDPLARFLSGFLNKCATRAARYENICSFHMGSQPGFPLSQVMKWFKANHTVKQMNTHFTPQSMHCELSRRLHEYNLIGLMTVANFAQHATCIIERMKLGWLNEIGRNDGNPIFMVPADAKEKARKEVEILKKFFTKQFAHFLMDNVFAKDYKLFRIKRPEWVEEATGEWFEKRPPIWTENPTLLRTEAPKTQGGAGLFGGLGDDEDDIMKLAASLGYNVDV